MDKKRIFIYLISILLILFAAYLMIVWQKENKESADLTNSIHEIVKISEISDNDDNTDIVIINPPEEENITPVYTEVVERSLINVDLNNLIAQNSDTVAWLRVDGTNIDYPVLQTEDNNYYLTHSFNGNYNSSGWIFADYRNNLTTLDKNTIIYGHNRMNNTMFATLNNLTTDEWYNNKEWCIQLSTLTQNTLWQVFSVYKVPSETYYITTNFTDELVYQDFLNTILDRSYFDFETNLNFNDKILTLSTCTNVNDGRLVVHAKLIKSSNK